MPSSENVALVLGSGMAGLATAQVLSKFFQRVVVLEKDFPEANNNMSAVEVGNTDDPRPGVAQYKQLHALLAKGLCAYDDIFQGRFTKALIAAGANVVPLYGSYLFCHPISGYLPWLRNTTPKEQAYSAICTRHLLETTTRKLLADNPRVEFMYGASVTGLVFEGEEVGGVVAASADRTGGNKQQKAVAGVRLSDGSCLSAQLVVDCSGRGSNLPSWLAAAGFKRPRTSRADCNTGYCTWMCKLDPDVDALLREHNVYVHAALPAAPVQTFSLLMRIEGDVWLAGVGGNEGVHPGHKPGDLMAFAQQAVWHPGAARILAGSTQLSPACHNQGMGSSWRHYEEISLPDGLLVLGDAICSFNPQYGQGMTVAAIEATALKQLLTDRCDKSKSSSSSEWLHGLHPQLQKAVLPTIRLAWQLAVGGDMRYPSATSNDSASTNAVQQLMMSYVDILFKLAATDAGVNEGLLRVTNMLDEPSALFHPWMLSRVLTYKLMSYLPAPVVAVMHKVLQRGRALLPWLGGSAWAGGAQGSACVGAHKAVKGSVQWPEAVLRLLGVDQVPAASC